MTHCMARTSDWIAPYRVFGMNLKPMSFNSVLRLRVSLMNILIFFFFGWNDDGCVVNERCVETNTIQNELSKTIFLFWFFLFFTFWIFFLLGLINALIGFKNGLELCLLFLYYRKNSKFNELTTIQFSTSIVLPISKLGLKCIFWIRFIRIFLYFIINNTFTSYLCVEIACKMNEWGNMWMKSIEKEAHEMHLNNGWKRQLEIWTHLNTHTKEKKNIDLRMAFGHSRVFHAFQLKTNRSMFCKTQIFNCFFGVDTHVISISTIVKQKRVKKKKNLPI